MKHFFRCGLVRGITLRVTIEKVCGPIAFAFVLLTIRRVSPSLIVFGATKCGSPFFRSLM